MESEKVKEIKKALEDNANYEHHNKLGYIDGYKCKTVDYADILTLINELESENETIKLNIQETEKASFNINQMNGNLVLENQVLKDRIVELEDENERLKIVVDIANERTYRKKFIEEWRKEYQKELDKQGNGYIAGHPDFDLVYELYFEQKDRIAELEKENDELKVDLKNSIDMQKQMLDGFNTATKEVEENLAREIPNLLKRFTERLIEKYSYDKLTHEPDEDIEIYLTASELHETLKEYEK